MEAVQAGWGHGACARFAGEEKQRVQGDVTGGRGRRRSQARCAAWRLAALAAPTLRGLDFAPRGDTSIETSTRDISIETVHSA